MASDGNCKYLLCTSSMLKVCIRLWFCFILIELLHCGKFGFLYSSLMPEINFAFNV